MPKNDEVDIIAPQPLFMLPYQAMVYSSSRFSLVQMLSSVSLSSGASSKSASQLPSVSMAASAREPAERYLWKNVLFMIEMFLG